MDGSQNHYHHYHHHRYHYQQQHQQLQDQFVNSSTSTSSTYPSSSFLATVPPPPPCYDGGSSSSTTIGGGCNYMTWTPNHILNAAGDNFSLNANGVLSNPGHFREVPLVPDDPSLLINSSTATYSMIQQHRQEDDEHYLCFPWINSNDSSISDSFTDNHQYYNSADYEQYYLAEFFKKQLLDMSNITSLEDDDQLHNLPSTTTNYDIIRHGNHQQQADFSTIHGHINDGNDDDVKNLSINKCLIRQISIPRTNCISNLQNSDDDHPVTAASSMSLLSTPLVSTDFQGLDLLMSSRMNLGDDYQPAASKNANNSGRSLFIDALSLDHHLQSSSTDAWPCKDVSLDDHLQSSSTDPWPSNNHNQMMSSLVNGGMIQRNRLSLPSTRINVLKGAAWNSSTLKEGSLVDHQRRLTRRAALVARKANKKPQMECHYSSVPSKQVKVEKERIAALQHMVAPFGKTDKATVLKDAIWYIKSMEHQIETLSMPYTKSVIHTTVCPTIQQGSSEDGGSNKPKRNLKSRGLCAVPLSFTSYIRDDSFALGCVWPLLPNTGLCRGGP